MWNHWADGMCWIMNWGPDMSSIHEKPFQGEWPWQSQRMNLVCIPGKLVGFLQKGCFIKRLIEQNIWGETDFFLLEKTMPDQFIYSF